jgi:hypothetical protein
MWHWVVELDQILRGEKTRPGMLRPDAIDIPAAGLTVVLVALAAVYGVCMGTFALLRGVYPQMFASAVKLPLLFFLTLVVTFPSLYVFNALVGTRLSAFALLKLLIASLGVTLATLAALGPIVAFFSISTTSYSFMVLLNVVMCAVSGFLGLIFLLQTLNRLAAIEPRSPDAPPAEPGASLPIAGSPPLEISEFRPEGALDKLPGHVLGAHVKAVFRCWVVVFGLVGAQMGWVLRPFVGDPNREFQWLRGRDSNFFQAVWSTFLDFLM